MSRTMDFYIPPDLFPDDDTMSESSLPGGNSSAGEFGCSFLWTTTDDRYFCRRVDLLDQRFLKSTAPPHETKAPSDTNLKSKVPGFDVSQFICSQYCNLCSSRRIQMSRLWIWHQQRYAPVEPGNVNLSAMLARFLTSSAEQELPEEPVEYRLTRVNQRNVSHTRFDYRTR